MSKQIINKKKAAKLSNNKFKDSFVSDIITKVNLNGKKSNKQKKQNKRRISR